MFSIRSGGSIECRVKTISMATVAGQRQRACPTPRPIDRGKHRFESEPNGVGSFFRKTHFQVDTTLAEKDFPTPLRPVVATRLDALVTAN
jgi:hypothetical protein